MRCTKPDRAAGPMTKAQHICHHEEIQMAAPATAVDAVTVAAATVAAAQAMVAAMAAGGGITIRKDATSTPNFDGTQKPERSLCAAVRAKRDYFLSARFSAWWRGSVMMMVVPLPIALLI